MGSLFGGTSDCTGYASEHVGYGSTQFFEVGKELTYRGFDKTGDSIQHLS
jgi:hypothetical protein